MSNAQKNSADHSFAGANAARTEISFPPTFAKNLSGKELPSAACIAASTIWRFSTLLGGIVTSPRLKGPTVFTTNP